MGSELRVQQFAQGAQLQVSGGMLVSEAQPICQAGAAELFLHTNLFQGTSSGASLGTCRPGSQITVSCSTAAASCQQFFSMVFLGG